MLNQIALLIKDQKSKDRRPMMALLTGSFTREQAEKYVNDKISKREWREARMHNKYPGPLKPVEKIEISRQRISTETIETFFAWIRGEGLDQSYAYGDKNVTLANGSIVQLDAVGMNGSISHINKEYVKAKFPERRQKRDGGCPKRQDRSGCYCVKEENHEGKCKYSIENMLSASSIDAIIKTISSGQVKSRAGLDDEDVEKGSRSVDCMIEIYKILASKLKHTSDTIAGTKKKIENILTYHRTSFKSHLSRNGKKSCQCLSCGLHSSTDPVPCCYRPEEEIEGDGGNELETHDGPCEGCEQAFGVFDDLQDLIRQVFLLLSDEQADAVEREQYDELKIELERCKTNLIHWRSHIARKAVEKEYTHRQSVGLGPDEVIIICDFKMKILAMYLRETKQQFFGKRGTSCLGFLIMTNTQRRDGKHDVMYFLFFSDDTQQDANYVLAAKHYIYSNVLPGLFPDGTEIKVHFESDGAGCFNCTLLKATMPFWKDWTGVEEMTIRVSVSGDGKSSLDGLFGKLRNNFIDAVNNRVTDIYSADTCLAACQKGAGIEGASVAVLELDRKYDLATQKTIPRLTESHLIEMDRANNQLLTYTNSGYGAARPIGFETVKAVFEKQPDAPVNYIVRSQVNARGTALHSTETHQSRLKAKKKTTREKANELLEANHQAKVEAAKQQLLYLCPQLDQLTRRACGCRFRSQKQLDKHIQEGNHNFPSRDLVTTAVGQAACENGIYQFGSNPQASEAYANMDVKDGERTVLEEDVQFQPGCYRKAGRKKPQRLHEELKRILNEMYDEGETREGEKKRGANKYTTKQARDILAAMTLPNGLLKFSSHSPYGELPKEKTIRSYWSRLKTSRRLIAQKRNTQDTEEEVQEQIQEWVANALDGDAIGVDAIGVDAIDDDAIGDTTALGNDEVDQIEIAECELTEQAKKGGNNNKKRGLGHKAKSQPSNPSNQGKFSGKIFVLDGVFPNDDEKLKGLIKSNGGKYQNNITKNVG